MSTERRPRCVVVGGGGHARVVIDAIVASGMAIPVAVLDADRSRWGAEVLGVPIVGGDDQLAGLVRGGGVTHFIVGVGGTGDNDPRRRLFERALGSGLLPLTVRHPAAVCAGSAHVGDGSLLCATAVVQAAAVVGLNAILNTGSIVEHDCVLGNHVHLATGARLCSTVRVGEGAHIGAGATVRQCLSIGEGALIGAGAVVIDDVAPRQVVVGVPARPLQPAQLAETSSRAVGVKG